MLVSKEAVLRILMDETSFTAHERIYNPVAIDRVELIFKMLYKIQSLPQVDETSYNRIMSIDSIVDGTEEIL